MSDDSVRSDTKDRALSQETGEQQLTTVLESIGDGFFSCDAEWRFVYVNATAERILGINRDELLGKSLWEVFPLKLGTPLEQEFRRAAVGEIRDFENFYQPRGCWFHNRCFPRKGGGLSIYFQDVTDRKRAEKALLHERNVLQAVMNGAKNSHLVYLDRDFNFVRVNETYAVTCGYRPEEMIGKNHFALYPHAENEAIFAQVRDTGEVFEAHDKPFEFPDHPERGVTWWDWTLSPVKDETGEVIGLVFSLFETTSRKRVEEQLRRAEAYARNLIEVNLDLLVTIAPDGRISDLNKASMLATGYSREEMIGTDFSSYFTDPDEARAGYQQVFEKGIVRDYPLEIRHRDGHVTPVLYNASVFLDETRQIAGVFAAARDITQLKQAEEQLKALNYELERRVEQRTLELQETQKQYLHAEKLSAIGKLSASIAHEFNNPLQGILSILKGLRKRAIMEEEDRELLDAAIGESERIKNLIRSLQDFNRPSSGRKVSMDLHKSLDNLLLMNKSDFKNKRISLVLDYAEGLPQILAVPDQIKQVLLNLLTNAADACQESGGVITVSTRQEDDKVAVAIKDTGVGIKPEEMELIFQPFYTTKPEVKGTGLGLSVSYGIVNNHGGEILVTSRPGEGATFTVLLPIEGGGDLVEAAEK